MRFQYQNIKKAEHGGVIKKSSHEDRDTILDFSVNLNPYPPDLDYSLTSEEISQYPDDSYLKLKEIIARNHKRKSEEICVGNGSVEVIRTLCHTILQPGTNVYVPPHTFSEYALSAELAGAEIKQYDHDEITLSFLCNPDNPSGILTQRKDVLEYLDQIVQNKGTLCIDEAFIDLADPEQSVADINNPSLFIVRSLTKSFSMAGVRFGYGIGDPDLVSAMEVMRPPWSVNAFAEKMAIQAFQRYQELDQSRNLIKTERNRIQMRASELGIKKISGTANYLLLDIGYDVSELILDLLKSGIYVRDCHSFGLPSSIRIAIRKPEENSIFLEALEKCLH